MSPQNAVIVIFGVLGVEPVRDGVAQLVDQHRHEHDRDPDEQEHQAVAGPPADQVGAEQGGDQEERPLDVDRYRTDPQSWPRGHLPSIRTATTVLPSIGAVTAELPQGEDKVRAVRDMFDAIAPRYDLVNRLMTFRLDVRWRRRTVARLALAPGASIVDLACGTGDLCRDLVKAGHRPIGIDMSYGMLAAARTSAPLVNGDALRMPFADGSVDGAHLRVRAAQLRRARADARRDGPHRAPRRSDRAARGGDAAATR